MNETVYTLTRGTGPLLVSLPHVGTHIPEALRARFVDRALQVEDTDWFLDRLYAFAAWGPACWCRAAAVSWST